MITLLDQDFSQLNQYLAQLNPSKLFFLVDENTHKYCLPIVLGNLTTQIPYEIMEIEPGEEMKTINTAAQLWEILAEFEADRKSLLVNLGGGVITDLGGFVGSTYKRGIKFINVPTTLLAMCDASIGGKTGIDHGFLKNMVGTFAHSEKIFLFPDFLKTLPFDELRSGFAEMLKHGLIADRKHWENLISIENLSAENLSPYIKRSMEIKQTVVEKDFKEENLRKILNFGHTIGHAVESLFLQAGKPVLHGEAVAAGMICEAKIGEIKGILDTTKTETVIKNILKYFPVLSLSTFSDENLLRLMKNDKKNTSKNISFSLISDIGSCIFDETVDEDILRKSIFFYKSLH